MSYRWSLEGPGFEFPTPFTLENKVLRLRAYALVLLGLGILLLTLLTGDAIAEGPMAIADEQPTGGTPWPHAFMALVVAGLGVLDFLQLARQRVLRLVPGQPGGLIQQIRREGQGVSPQASWLMRAVGQGEVTTPLAPAADRSWGHGERDDWAPTSLQVYRQTRLSHLALFGGLWVVFLLAFAVLNAKLLARPAGLGLVSLLLIGVAVAAVVRQLLDGSKAALSPKAVAVALVASALVALPIAWFGDALPRASSVERLGLPWAAGALLALLVLVEALALKLARTPADQALPSAGGVTGDEVHIDAAVNASHLMREVDLELHRRWQEGVPNRRYGWRHVVQDSEGEPPSFSALVLEESQPQPLPGAQALSAASAGRGPWLAVLAYCALAASVLGAAGWLWTAWTHMHNASASWRDGALSLVGLAIGFHALRLGHLPGSRVEVDSQLLWLDFAAPAHRQVDEATAARQRPEASWRLEGLTMRACVARLRSVFYAAGADEPGSRRLLGLRGDTATAASWTALIEDLARTADEQGRLVSGAAAAPRATPAKGEIDRAPRQAHRPARFCGACGSPVLAGARFCQQCGATIAQEG